MHSRTASIQPLPADVVAQIKSSISITRLSDVVQELIKNSLDANAQTITINVDFQRGGCLVEDDGTGIPPSEFKEGGGLGKIHRMTVLASSRSPTHDEQQIHRK
jgi:DNA mismatch repair protein MLH3